MDHDDPSELPNKRQRTEPRNVFKGRKHGGDSNTPTYSDRDLPPTRRHEHRNVSRNKARRSDFHRPSYPPSYRPSATVAATPITHTKSKADRKSNPSSRIHSLRRLLQRDPEGLPRTVRQEKERELTALLLDQEKAKLRTATKRNLGKYHMVRFFERQRAERNLKSLVKSRDDEETLPTVGEDDGNEDADSQETSREKLDRLIHEAQVDIAYTQYAPLGEKYISLFAEEKNKAGRPKKNPLPVQKRHLRMFTTKEQQELKDAQNEGMNVMFTAAGSKPPIWHEVEQCMANGEQAKLEALRDGKSNNHTTFTIGGQLAAIGGKIEAAERSAATVSKDKKKRKKPASLGEGGYRIDSPVHHQASANKNDVDVDVEMSDSDGDGGFFER